MKEITIRGLDEELVRTIRDMSGREGISPSEAALRLLRRGAGLDSSVVGSSLDHLIGTWTEEDERIMNEAIEDLDKIDGLSCP